MKRFLGPAMIVLCTVIWGAAFLAQKMGADHFGPFSITCYRNVLGGLFLAGVVALQHRGSVRCTRQEAIGGAASGLCLFVAMIAQQLGIEKTTAGISAFLTANYVLLVPVFAWCVGKGRPRLPVWLGVALALVGTGLICFQDVSSQFAGLRLGAGEAWTLLCAGLFAIQIMVVDRFARDVDVVRFSMVQLFVSAGCSLPFVFLPSELARAGVSQFVAGIPSLLFLGILSSGIAYTLQNLGQARTPPALAAIIMSLESVFGAFFGWLFLHDAMTARQLCGCGLVLLAVIASQLLSLSVGSKR